MATERDLRIMEVEKVDGHITRYTDMGPASVQDGMAARMWRALLAAVDDPATLAVTVPSIKADMDRCGARVVER